MKNIFRKCLNGPLYVDNNNYRRVFGNRDVPHGNVIILRFRHPTITILV